MTFDHPCPMPADESDLADRLRAGDELAYHELVTTCGGRMLAVARRLLADEEEARDAVQAAFLCAFRAVDRFAGQAKLSTWLHRIVVNEALMRLRRRKRRPEAPLSALLPTFLDDGHHAEPISTWALPDREIERQQVRAVVRRCIAQLPATARTVIVLRDIEEHDTEHVAAMLGITPNAVKIRLHRARQALATLLRRELGGPGATPSTGRPGPTSGEVARRRGAEGGGDDGRRQGRRPRADASGTQRSLAA